MSEYWFISAPADETCEETWKTMEELTRKLKSFEMFKFHLPNLKVGTLDQLIALSDELAKVDRYVGQVAHRVAHCLREVVVDKEIHNEDLLVCEEDLPTYLTTFKWDSVKYPARETLKNITDTIAKQTRRIDADLQTKSLEYQRLKNRFEDEESKQSGSLFTRNLGDIVKEEHFVLGSEYLTTLLVVVPRELYGDWYSSYETIAQMTVPKSTKLVFEDEESGLFTVTLFKSVVDEFQLKAGRKRFVVRQFSYDEDELAEDKAEFKKLRINKMSQLGKIKRWLKVSFSETFSAWIHLKGLRVFVESVLRYGLPVNFQAMLVHPEKKSMKRVRDMLNERFAHLDCSYVVYGPSNDYGISIPGLDLGANEYLPYVNFDIDIDVLDPKKFR